MSEQEKGCDNCGNLTGPCVVCLPSVPSAHPNWTPKPAAAKALPTLAELDAEIATCGDGWHETGDMLRAIRPLVEEAECKAAIVAEGCDWKHHSDGWIWVDRPYPIGRSNNAGHRFDDWPSARDWALEQAAAREEEAAKQKARERIAAAGARVKDWIGRVQVWAEDGETRTFDDYNREAGKSQLEQCADFAEAHRAKAEWSEPLEVVWNASGYVGRFLDIVEFLGIISPVSTDYLRGYADAKGRLDRRTDRVWLGDGPMPQ